MFAPFLTRMARTVAYLMAASVLAPHSTLGDLVSTFAGFQRVPYEINDIWNTRSEGG